MKRITLHPITFAIFPILALIGHNIHEISLGVSFRSLIIAILTAGLILILLSLIVRNWQKGAVLTTYLVFLFFSYGQVYEFLKAHPIFGFSLGRHRYLSVVYGLVLVAGLAWIFIKLKKMEGITQYLNILGLVLLIYPVFQIASYSLTNSLASKKAVAQSSDQVLKVESSSLPDIYYIILDTYTRADALQTEYGYDNSSFLNTLRGMGFYVADCSRSNYGETRSSITTALNMNYLTDLQQRVISQGLNSGDVWTLLDKNEVRAQLASIGYKTVAFETGYEATWMKDANIYLQYNGTPVEFQLLQPFEFLLIRSTALLIWSDYKSLTPASKVAATDQTRFIFGDHIDREHYILSMLPKIPTFPGPKFVFVHILIPHPPYVFEPNGDLVTDPGYYTGPKSGPIDDEYFVKGYTNEVSYINSQMAGILQTIISTSSTPPIIVLQGDHGPKSETRYQNLSTFYLPGNGSQNLYPTITPVNSFRIIFNTYFGTHYSLLPDVSYDGDGNKQVETAPQCIQK